MIFVTGGLASGKRTFARSLGFAEDEVALNVHELVRGRPDAAGLAGELSRKAVVTCAEVGSGIVPADAADRAYREAAGRLAADLAERADSLVRMVCGVPLALKGPLPSGRTELVLLRHGQTAGNAQGRYVGRALDQPLSDEGRAQARAQAPLGQVERVFVSCLARTHETASLMFPGARQVQVPGIEEMDFGSFTGRSADEMADDPEYRAWVEGGCEGRCPGGESRGGFSDRVCRAMTGLLRGECDRGEGRVVVVGHGGTMMAFLDRFAGDGRAYWEWLAGNCGGYRIQVRFDSGRLFLDSVTALQ